MQDTAAPQCVHPELPEPRHRCPGVSGPGDEKDVVCGPCLAFWACIESASDDYR